jgi:hypothetical protein
MTMLDAGISPKYSSAPLAAVTPALPYCVRCLDAGHQCMSAPANVNDSEPLCIFCEDGEPCPRASRAPQHSPLMVGDLVKPRAHFGEPHQIVTPTRPAKKKKSLITKESPMPDKTCGHDGCEKQLSNANHSGFCTAHFYDSKRKGDEKFCSKCGDKLRSDNNSGLCKPCKKGTTAPAPKPAKRGRPAKSSKLKAKIPLPTPPEVDELLAANETRAAVSLVITEQQLDRMFLNWPLEDKLLCVQAHLDREGV